MAWLADKAVALVPTRKSVARSFLFALLGSLPVIMIVVIRLPHIALPLFALIGFGLSRAGFGKDLWKQLRWMKRMSGQGPIFWAIAFVERRVIRFSRWYWGDQCDVLPERLEALGTVTRGATSAKVRWIPAAPTSSFSVEAYDVQIRPVKTAAIAGAVLEAVPYSERDTLPPPPEDVDDPNSPSPRGGEHDEVGWIELVTGHPETELMLKPLAAGTAYEVRVRASNSKGSASWRTLAFATKQKPLQQQGGAGGEGAASLAGASYRWLQSLKDQSVSVSIGPLPAGTRGKQLVVAMKPQRLSVALLGEEVLAGELFAPIVPDDCSWELKDAEGGQGRELQLTLVKAKPPTKGDEPPLWSSLLKGGPEVDMTGVKREDKSLEEIMAELKEADPDAMKLSQAQNLKKGMGFEGLE